MREISFYPAIKNDNKKYEPILFDVNGVPQSIYWRSQSFIDIKKFTEGSSLKNNDIEEKYLEYFDLCIDEKEENRIIYLYPFSLKELENMASDGNKGLFEGYVEKEEAKTYYSLDNKFDKQDYYHWEMTKYPAEFIASLPIEEQKEYIKFSHLDYFSPSYTANLMVEVLDSIIDTLDYKNIRKDNTYILVDYSF